MRPEIDSLTQFKRCLALHYIQLGFRQFTSSKQKQQPDLQEINASEKRWSDLERNLLEEAVQNGAHDRKGKFIYKTLRKLSKKKIITEMCDKILCQQAIDTLRRLERLESLQNDSLRHDDTEFNRCLDILVAFFRRFNESTLNCVTRLLLKLKEVKRENTDKVATADSMDYDRKHGMTRVPTKELDFPVLDEVVENNERSDEFRLDSESVQGETMPEHVRTECSAEIACRRKDIQHILKRLDKLEILLSRTNALVSRTNALTEELIVWKEINSKADERSVQVKDTAPHLKTDIAIHSEVSENNCVGRENLTFHHDGNIVGDKNLTLHEHEKVLLDDSFMGENLVETGTFSDCSQTDVTRQMRAEERLQVKVADPDIFFLEERKATTKCETLRKRYVEPILDDDMSSLSLQEEDAETHQIGDLKPCPQPNLVLETLSKLPSHAHTDSFEEAVSSGYPLKDNTEITCGSRFDISSENSENLIEAAVEERRNVSSVTSSLKPLNSCSQSGKENISVPYHRKDTEYLKIGHLETKCHPVENNSSHSRSSSKGGPNQEAKSMRRNKSHDSTKQNHASEEGSRCRSVEENHHMEPREDFEHRNISSSAKPDIICKETRENSVDSLTEEQRYGNKEGKSVLELPVTEVAKLAAEGGSLARIETELDKKLDTESACLKTSNDLKKEIPDKAFSGQENIKVENEKPTHVKKDTLENRPNERDITEKRNTSFECETGNVGVHELGRDMVGYDEEVKEGEVHVSVERKLSFSRTACELSDQDQDQESEISSCKTVDHKGCKKDTPDQQNDFKAQADIAEDKIEEPLGHISRTVSILEDGKVYGDGKKRHVRRKRKKFSKRAFRRREFPAGENCSLDTSIDNSSLYPGSSTKKRNIRCKSDARQPRHFQPKTKDTQKECHKKISSSRSAVSEFSTLKTFAKCMNVGSSNIKDSGICMSFTSSISFEPPLWQYCPVFSPEIKKRHTQMNRLQLSLKIDKTKKKRKGTNSKLRSLLRKFFEKKYRTKEIARQLHVQHGISYQVFGIGSYFDQLNRGEVPSLRERMRYEWLRLASFQHYQGAGSSLALARNGFYHNPADGSTSTRCYLCEAAYSDWQLFQNVEDRHRQLSPNCPFHTGRLQPSVNDAITYDAVPPTSRLLDSARVGGASGQSSAVASGLGTSNSSAAASSSASGFSILSTSSATGNSIREVERSLAQGQATTDSIGRHAEITAQQPEENDENRDRSLLALPNTRAFRVLGRSGEDAYAHLTTPPRRNNVAVGAETNAGLDPLQTSVATSIPTGIVSSTTLTTMHSSIFEGPIGAGAFGRSAASTQITTSTTATTSIASTLTPQSSVVPTVQTSTAPTSTVAGASSILRPSDPPIGGGGRTDPTITVVVDNPKHPDYRNIDDRVNSFQGWPEYLDQTPRQMSEAGFFFVGVADFTRCFCCGGGLRNWEPGDDPMLEHTRWFPRCEYVNKLKGERYVAAVQRRHQEHMEQQQREQVEAAQRRDANRNPPDPMSTETAAVLREMGYQPERIREAILTVRQRTGSSDVTTQQVLTYLLDENEDRRPPPTTARQSPTDLGVKINELNLPSTTTAIETMPTTTVVNTTSVSTESSTVSAGTNFTSAVSLPKATKAEIQTSASTTSASSEASNKLTGSSSKEGKGNEQTGSSGNEAKGSSYAEKQSAASVGESDGEYQSAEESLTTETKSSKKKTKKKGKTKLGSKSGATGGPNIDTRTLKEENEKLREMQTCKICMERPVNTTLLPCGHLVCCDICASRLNRCPICRKRIKGTVKTFMS